MSRVRDIFFDEFYNELESTKTNFLIEDEVVKPPILKNVVNQHWIQFIPNIEDREEILISVDGGVQNSELAYGYFISVARACALIHVPNQPR